MLALRRRYHFGAVVLFALSCGDSSSTSEHVSTQRAAIINGRPSGDDENAAVLVETTGEKGTLHCTGHLVAPNLVLTVRHCLLKDKRTNLLCNPDGSPSDLGSDQTLEPTANIAVKVGSQVASLRTIAVKQALTVLEVSVCKADIAFLVLTEDALPIHTPFRRKPVRIGDSIKVIGWGVTADGETNLPVQRRARDDLHVTDVGPGFLPAGNFAIGGASICGGDSGASALSDGAIVGADSRRAGDRCDAIDSSNIFTAIATQEALITRAFAAIGETPRYADADALPMADAGVLDASNEAAPSNASNPPPAADDGCSLAGSSSLSLSQSWLFVIAVVVLLQAFTKRARRLD